MTPGGSLGSVQALRAFAALAVVLYHVDFIGKGAFGVDVFFIISGFIMCYVTASDRSHFLAKRLIRILPLYWAATLGVFALALIAPKLLGATTASYADLFRSLFFIPYEKEAGRVVPILFLGWTLNYEMLFYGIFALALTTRNAPLTACVTIAALVAAGQLLPFDSVVWRFYTSPILYEFCYGIALYALWTRVHGRVRLPVGPAVFMALAALGPLVLVDVATDGPFRYIAWGLPAAVLVAAVLSQQDRIRFAAGIVALGDASYSLYLLHPYALKAFEKAFGPFSYLTLTSAAAAAAAIAASVLGAVIVYRLFEKPASRYLRQALLAPRRPVHVPLAS
jgi:exopolysaccharide production protein ExoZ